MTLPLREDCCRSFQGFYQESPMPELKGALYEPEAWLVWNLDRPSHYCTVVSKTWFEARAKGATRLHWSRTDARLKTDKPLEVDL